MTLRWQDVAGHVAAPDTSGAASMITRGIEGLGSAIQNILLAPEMRRRADLMQQAKIAGMKSDVAATGAAQANAMGKEIKASRKEKAVEDFGRVRSQLEELAFNSALSGKGLDPVIQSELYQSLSPEARAHADGLLSGVLREGIRTADARREAAIDNARQAEALALQRASAARDAEFDVVRLRVLKREEQTALDAADPLRRVSNPATKDALRQYSRDVLHLRSLADLSPFRDKSAADILAKQGGLPRNSLWGADAASGANEIKNGWETANKRLRDAGYDELPPEAMAYAAQNAGVAGFWGTTEPDDYLFNLGVTRTNASRAEKALIEMQRRGEAGAVLSYDPQRFRQK